MGFFGAYLLVDGDWSEVDPDNGSTAPAEPWMFVSVHDSDLATVRYSPPGEGTGEAFLGFTPRSYFEDEDASEPTDAPREARGLAAWAQLASGRSIDVRGIQEFLATDDGELVDESNELDDADIFVEIKCAHFLAHLGLSPPADLNAP